MFVINIYLRFALIALFLGGGIALAFLYGFWYASVPILIGLVLLVGYIFFGTVASAGQLVQKMDMQGAEKRLDLTFRPGWLYSTNRAMFYIMKSSLAIHRNENEVAEKWLQKASTVKLNSDNEKAMIEFQMAGIAAKRGNMTKLKMHMKRLNELNITDPTIKEQVKEFDKAIKSQGTKNAGLARKQGMAFQPGGKRRRPKMR